MRILGRGGRYTRAMGRFMDLVWYDSIISIVKHSKNIASDGCPSAEGGRGSCMG